LPETKRSAIEDTSDREVLLTRVFDAPRELVWDAFIDPQQVVQWWGPNGFTTTIHEMDVRPGGVWRHTMHGPDGTKYPNDCVFLELVKPERIVYSQGWTKAGDHRADFLVTWTFEEQGAGTKLTLRMVFPTKAICEEVAKTYGVVEGGKQTLERFAQYLTKA
jgi:uncharacterized protein YndB with AHSA1/START domain